jgi:Phospholipase_D-nuclease N-terminal
MVDGGYLMTTTGPRVHTEAILGNVLLALVVIVVPILGHIILTPIILRDELPTSHKVGWLLVVWIFWVVGPFLYLLLGQRRNRLFSLGTRAASRTDASVATNTIQPWDPTSPTEP